MTMKAIRYPAAHLFREDIVSAPPSFRIFIYLLYAEWINLLLLLLLMKSFTPAHQKMRWRAVKQNIEIPRPMCSLLIFRLESNSSRYQPDRTSMNRLSAAIKPVNILGLVRSKLYSVTIDMPCRMMRTRAVVPVHL